MSKPTDKWNGREGRSGFSPIVNANYCWVMVPPPTNWAWRALCFPGNQNVRDHHGLECELSIRSSKYSACVWYLYLLACRSWFLQHEWNKTKGHCIRKKLILPTLKFVLLFVKNHQHWSTFNTLLARHRSVVNVNKDIKTYLYVSKTPLSALL